MRGSALVSMHWRTQDSATTQPKTGASAGGRSRRWAQAMSLLAGAAVSSGFSSLSLLGSLSITHRHPKNCASLIC